MRDSFWLISEETVAIGVLFSVLLTVSESEKIYDKNIPQFLADEKLMRMIFQNLLSNAAKYTPIDGVIKVSLLKVGKGKKFGGKTMIEESLGFSVSDPGVGIPTYQQGRVFSKLFRADNIKESEPEGTGLGLYVVKSVADQSGGSVWFTSEENKGSIFYVSFPITGMKITKREGQNTISGSRVL